MHGLILAKILLCLHGIGGRTSQPSDFCNLQQSIQNDSTKPGARDEEARCTEGKVNIKISDWRHHSPEIGNWRGNSSFPDWESNSCNLGRHAARLRSNLNSLLIGAGMQGRDAAERVRDFVWR